VAGHSKWANIKRQKARVDLKKGKTFAQLSRAIIVATRSGSSDPDGNFQLKTAIDKAKAAGIPNDNIDRAIAIGAGTYQDDSSILEEIRYEGYGAGGVAILIEALTDNRNRSAADIRAAFKKNDGNLGETGCVSWMFEQKGVIILDAVEEDTLLEAATEGGADNYESIDDEDFRGVEVFTEVTNLEFLNQTLQKQNLPITEVELRWIPSNTITITDLEQARSILKLIDTLESLDDVQNVTANFKMTTELMKRFLH
jgi:YebC/PmpR family DNA-binding regulatory protein